MTEREINQACVQRHLKAEMMHDMETTLATLHPDCLFEDRPIGLTLRGRDQARRHYELWWSAFGIGLDSGKQYWAADDLLIAEVDFVGRHVGDFLGIAPTGREIRLPIVVVVGFRDGFLASERFTYDLNDLLRQLGQPAFQSPLAGAA